MRNVCEPRLFIYVHRLLSQTFDGLLRCCLSKTKQNKIKKKGAILTAGAFYHYIHIGVYVFSVRNRALYTAHGVRPGQQSQKSCWNNATHLLLLFDQNNQIITRWVCVCVCALVLQICILTILRHEHLRDSRARELLLLHFQQLLSYCMFSNLEQSAAAERKVVIIISRLRGRGLFAALWKQ